MEFTEELPIYRATYRLLNLLLHATQNFHQFYKYNQNTGVVNICLDMSVLLYKIHDDYEKEESIHEFLTLFSTLQMLLHICTEQKVIDTQMGTFFALEIKKIDKLATHWKRYSEKRKREQK